MANGNSNETKLIQISEDILKVLKSVITRQKKQEDQNKTINTSMQALEDKVDLMSDRVKLYSDSTRSNNRFIWIVFCVLIIPVSLGLYSETRSNRLDITALDTKFTTHAVIDSMQTVNENVPYE
jgi:hypothetical protein